MPTKRHQETLAPSGDSVAFAELKRLKPGQTPELSGDSAARGGKDHEVVQHDHDLDRSETGDALTRAVERSNDKRGAS